MTSDSPRKGADRQAGLPFAGLMGAFDGATPYDAILDRLSALHPKLIDLSLDRVHHLLKCLGNPHQDLPPVVHLAGTNGKGSVIAILQAVLEAAEYKVHVHTSPHLVKFNERIRLAGKLISDDALGVLLEECEVANAGAPITLFEITTTAALLAFSRATADILILETGLGGRLDATNVVDHPHVTAITPISLDHQQFLGDTIEEIAREKAGILKPGVPCVIGAQVPEVLTVLEKEAARIAAPLLVQGRDWDLTETSAGFELTLNGKTESYPSPALAGRHQKANAAQALVCFDVLTRAEERFTATPAQIAQGLGQAEWPARLQRLMGGPLVDALPDGWELWLDGGHNAAAGETIAEHARDTWNDQPLHLICGMLNSKDPGTFLTPLAEQALGLTGVVIPEEENSLSAEDMADAARAAGFRRVDAAPTVAAALDNILAGASSPARVFICGSLYLAGIVLRENN